MKYMEQIRIMVDIDKISRDQKEKRIREYFNLNPKASPSFRNFSFSSRKMINDIQLKFIGASCFLTEFIDIDVKKKSRKDRTFFFIFLKGNKQKFNSEDFTSEIFDICTYFSKVSMIQVVFCFDDEFVAYKYSEEKGAFNRTYLGSEVNKNFDFIRQPDDYINLLISNNKYLEDCYYAFSGSKDTGLNFITNDYYDTRKYFKAILEAIDHKKKSIIFVHGPAGSGKTILAMRLLGLYKNARMLIINEYFDSELKDIFDGKGELDIRFFTSQAESEELILELIACNKYKISIRKYQEHFKQFIYNKYWKTKNENISLKEFFQKYASPVGTNYWNDLEDFAKLYQEQSFTPCELLIIDEIQRVDQLIIDMANKHGLLTVIFGDYQQKISPSNDDLIINPDIINDEGDEKLDHIIKTYKERKDFAEIPINYPIRISNSALEKINYLLGKGSIKSYQIEKQLYPINIFDSCQMFVDAFTSDTESQRFFCSYQDIWRYEMGEVFSQKVVKIKYLKRSLKFTFEDGFEAYLMRNNADKIAKKLNMKISDMIGKELSVIKEETKDKRYRIISGSKNDYYGLSELLKIDGEILSINKYERRQFKDKLLFHPTFKRRMFTPSELISREVRNIYLYLPKSIVIDDEIGFIDCGMYGARFYDKQTKTNFLLNQLYVLMTRATRKINLYCEDKQLASYFKERLLSYEVANSLFDI